MTQHFGEARRKARLRSSVLAGVGIGFFFLACAAIGITLGSAYDAWRNDRVTPVPLMAVDDPSVVADGAEVPAPNFQGSSTLPLAAPLPAPAADQVAVSPEQTPSAAPSPAPAGPRVNRAVFDGRAIHKVGYVRMLVTAYSPDRKSCGPHAHGVTASGMSVWTNAMNLVAADTRLLPFGSLVAVPGYNHDRPVPVLDRGGAIKGRHVDVLFPTDAQATAWGKRYVTIAVWDYDN